MADPSDRSGPAPEREAQPILASMAAGEAPPSARRWDPIAFLKNGATERIRHRDRRQDLDIDARGLYKELRGAVSGEVRFDRSSRALYATDASTTGRCRSAWWCRAASRTSPRRFGSRVDSRRRCWLGEGEPAWPGR